MRYKHPEVILWNFAKYIKENWEKIVDEKTHKQYRMFDENSRVVEMSDWSQSEIELYLMDHKAGKTDYGGATLSMKKRSKKGRNSRY